LSHPLKRNGDCLFEEDSANLCKSKGRPRIESTSVLDFADMTTIIAK
jgi:hypothetical protein